VKNTVETLRAHAIYESKERHEVHLRVAGFSGKIYVDLGDETYQAIELDAEGWRILDRPPVRFRRPSAMLPLPSVTGDVNPRIDGAACAGEDKGAVEAPGLFNGMAGQSGGLSAASSV
jgi:hypothetical protein